MAAKLARLDERIKVATSNQEVVDFGDVVFLAVRPQIAGSVLAEVRFRPDHHVISVIATAQTDIIKKWVGSVGRITRAIPLPFVAFRHGMTAIYPVDPVASGLFNALGSAIEAQTESELDLFLAASALMGPYFQTLSACSRWLTDKGMSEPRARAYLDALFSSLSRTASEHADTSFDDLKDEFSTLGGLNEQAARVLQDKDAPRAFQSALESVHCRVTAGATLL
jgi:pyrroline-5-carboxylate reductase